MILVDTSVWIELLGPAPKKRVRPDLVPRLATCGPVIQEVLQGARAQVLPRIRAGMLALPRLGGPLDVELHLEAAALYRRARERGVTVRSSVDCLIAAIALRHDATVWHADRDYDALARFASLKTTTAREP